MLLVIMLALTHHTVMGSHGRRRENSRRTRLDSQSPAPQKRCSSRAGGAKWEPSTPASSTRRSYSSTSSSSEQKPRTLLSSKDSSSPRTSRSSRPSKPSRSRGHRRRYSRSPKRSRYARKRSRSPSSSSSSDSSPSSRSPPRPDGRLSARKQSFSSSKNEKTPDPKPLPSSNNRLSSSASSPSSSSSSPSTQSPARYSKSSSSDSSRPLDPHKTPIISADPDPDSFYRLSSFSYEIIHSMTRTAITGSASVADSDIASRIVEYRATGSIDTVDYLIGVEQPVVISFLYLALYCCCCCRSMLVTWLASSSTGSRSGIAAPVRVQAK